MPIPSFEQLLQPTLDALRQADGVTTIKAIDHQVIHSLGLAPEDVAQPHGNTSQTEVEYRLAWARTYLKQYGLIDNPKRGAWTLTEQGRATEQVDPKTVSTFVQELIKQGKVDNEKPADEIAGQTGLDIIQRLAQWRQEATDPAHPNYYHADLDQPVAIYAAISRLLQKLRSTPEEFNRDDVVALFGILNSGQRMKNKVADKNPLPVLRETLLALVDGAGTPTDKIAMADRALKFASDNMLGELYGWANPETAPLHNGCAIAALHHLGYTFDDKDYMAFVAAHEQFKQVYQQQVGRLRPDLPLNLEIDKFYNVIDKVDLKQNIPQRAWPSPSATCLRVGKRPNRRSMPWPQPLTNWMSLVQMMNGSPSICATKPASISYDSAMAGGWFWGSRGRVERCKKLPWHCLPISRLFSHFEANSSSKNLINSPFLSTGIQRTLFIHLKAKFNRFLKRRCSM